MTALLVASVVLLWAVVLGLAFTVFALARQIGVLHERVAPVGALAMGGGPEVGDPAPRIAVQLLDGGSFSLARSPERRMRLLMFVSSDCPICKRLIPIAKTLAKEEAAELVFVGDAEVSVQRAMIARARLEGYPFVNGPELGMALHVGKLPYAVLVNEDGLIAAKGLVNSREHLESLFTAKSAGVASIQEFLHNRRLEAGAEGV